MARLILWAVLIYLVVRALSRLTRGMLEGAGYRRDARQPQSVGLVKDPVCGVFVVPSKALTSGHGSETKFFCSEQCRQAWNRR